MKRKKKNLNSVIIKVGFFLLGVLFSCLGYTQNDTIAINDSSNIESYKQKLNIYLFGIQKFNNFEIKNKEQKTKLEYSPNENLNLGLGFNYKWLGLGMAFNFRFVNSDSLIYGKTKSFDFQADIYTNSMLINGNIQIYKGYYWRNPNDFYPKWNIRDSAIVRPDIVTVTAGVSAIHIFNHENFSFKAAFQSMERQKTSAGSWLLAGKASLYGMAADSSIIPAAMDTIFPLVKDIGGLSTVNLGGAFGYTHTFVFNTYFYFNAAFMIGLNLQSISTNDFLGKNINSEGKLSTNAFFRAALGCNKPTHFYGLTVSADSYLLTNPNATEFSYNYGKIRFFYGRRFNVGVNS